MVYVLWSNFRLPVGSQLLYDFLIFRALNTVIAKVNQIPTFEPKVHVGSSDTNGVCDLLTTKMTTLYELSLTIESILSAKRTSSCYVITLWVVILAQKITQEMLAIFLEYIWYF